MAQNNLHSCLEQGDCWSKKCLNITEAGNLTGTYIIDVSDAFKSINTLCWLKPSLGPFNSDIGFIRSLFLNYFNSHSICFANWFCFLLCVQCSALFTLHRFTRMFAMQWTTVQYAMTSLLLSFRDQTKSVRMAVNIGMSTGASFAFNGTAFIQQSIVNIKVRLITNLVKSKSFKWG